MNSKRMPDGWIRFVGAGLLAAALAGCGGGSGSGSPAPITVDAPTSGISTGSAGLAAAQSLKITVTGVTMSGGKPVVDFTVANELGNGMTGIVAADLRFNIAKLVPGAGGGPADWQNYINRSRSGAVQASQERVGSGFVFGTLVGHGSGRYSYTFATDIADPGANPCPAPCTDASGKPLDIRFEAGLTHRVTVQQANRAYPEASGVLDFVPAGGSPTVQRDVVSSASCNTCHGELTAHGSRVDTRLCVTCHNPGSWIAGSPNQSVDFKVMVHRIHYNKAGAALPSVLAGTPYKLGADDFSKVRFTQDVRNCTLCHDGSAAAANATPQGDHWKTAPSIASCGSCHDDVYFGSTPEPTKPFQTKAHSGGPMTDSSTCALCHAAGRFTDAKDIAVAHNFPARLKAASAAFQYNVVSVASTAPGANPVVTFSVTDPTRGGAPYDIKAAPAFTAAGGASTLTVKLAWTTADFANDGSGQSYGQPISINALTAATPGPAAGTYTVTSPVAVPLGQTGTLRVMIEGHPAGDVTTPGSFTDRLAVRSAFKDAAITGAVVARRVSVNIAKCNVCHGVLTLHGNNRTDEIGVCTMCHNANATDASRRPKTGGALSGGVDGKLEESVDFKTMIHGIHAGQVDKGGKRVQGVTVYGFGGSVNDFTGVVFPNSLGNCALCHTDTGFTLTGVWAEPTANGILGTTVATGVSAIDPADNLRMSPTLAVCSSCHDSAPAKAHMTSAFEGGVLSATQATITATVTENCASCHGEGRAFDVKKVHPVK